VERLGIEFHKSGKEYEVGMKGQYSKRGCHARTTSLRERVESIICSESCRLHDACAVLVKAFGFWEIFKTGSASRQYTLIACE
jgi:hypothetical protein